MTKEVLNSQPPHIEQELHRQQASVDLRSARPVIDRAQAVETHGINGDIMAIISLPGEGVEGKAKEIGVVDYGEPDPANPSPVFIFEGQPLKMFGTARTRYGLWALNYVSEELIGTYTAFPEGAITKLGRASDVADTINASHFLGLSDGSQGNQAISRQHATVQIKDGQLTVWDHSKNGTKITYANPEATQTSTELAMIQEELGNEALGAAGVVMPENENAGQKIAELTAHLSEEDQRELRYYASAMGDKRTAQARGAGEDSIYLSQVAGRHYRQLSPEARKIASQYERLFLSE